MSEDAKTILKSTLDLLLSHNKIKNLKEKSEIENRTWFLITELRAYLNIETQAQIGGSTTDRINGPQNLPWRRSSWNFTIVERMNKFSEIFQELSTSPDKNHPIVQNILQEQQYIINVFKNYVSKLEKDMKFIEE